jgi:hypothetical protein
MHLFGLVNIETTFRFGNATAFLLVTISERVVVNTPLQGNPLRAGAMLMPHGLRSDFCP